MITTTNAEFQDIYNKSELIFMNNVKDIMNLQKAGFVDNNKVQICCDNLNELESLKTYFTGDFEEKGYFNTINSRDVFNIFKSINK